MQYISKKKIIFVRSENSVNIPAGAVRSMRSAQCGVVMIICQDQTHTGKSGHAELTAGTVGSQ